MFVSSGQRQTENLPYPQGEMSQSGQRTKDWVRMIQEKMPGMAMSCMSVLPKLQRHNMFGIVSFPLPLPSSLKWQWLGYFVKSNPFDGCCMEDCLC
jgi:hypothetical protein